MKITTKSIKVNRVIWQITSKQYKINQAININKVNRQILKVILIQLLVQLCRLYLLTYINSIIILNRQLNRNKNILIYQLDK